MHRISLACLAFLFSAFMLSPMANASSCDFTLSGFIVKNFHRSTIKEVMTPFEDSSDRVKTIINAVRESWLNYGRPDYLSAKNLGTLFTDHFAELTAAEADLDKIIHKIELPEEKTAAKNYVLNLASDLQNFQKMKYIPPQEFQRWSMRSATFYNYVRTAKDKQHTSLRFGNFLDLPSQNMELYSGKNTTTLPIALSADPLKSNDFSRREINDLWILNIAVIGLTRIDRPADGDVKMPINYTSNDFSHAKDLDEKYKHLSSAQLLHQIKNNLQIYRNFRKLQSEEKDPRKKEIREAIVFTLLHEAITVLFNSSIAEKIDSLTDTIKIKFIERYGFNEGFKPYVTKEEVVTEIKWLKANWIHN